MGLRDEPKGENKMSEKNIAQTEQEQYFPILEGIKMYALGDSLFFGARIGTENSWPSLLGVKYNMDFINYGRGSNTIAKSCFHNKCLYLFVDFIIRFTAVKNCAEF